MDFTTIGQGLSLASANSYIGRKETRQLGINPRSARKVSDLPEKCDLSETYRAKPPVAKIMPPTLSADSSRCQRQGMDDVCERTALHIGNPSILRVVPSVKASSMSTLFGHSVLRNDTAKPLGACDAVTSRSSG